MKQTLLGRTAEDICEALSLPPAMRRRRKLVVILTNFLREANSLQSPCEHHWGGPGISFPAEMFSDGQTLARRIYLEYCADCGVLRLSHVCRVP